MIAKRFAAAGIRLSHSERQRFARALDGRARMPVIQRNRPAGTQQVVALTPDDNREFKKSLRTLVKSGTAMIPRMADDEAAQNLKALKRLWPTQQLAQQRSFHVFQRRLLKRWGEPLSKLDLLITVARETGERIAATVRVPGVGSPYQIDALTRLHARACQIAFEIHTLLMAGLADGAMARCRTLQEIAATAFFIQEHGEETAERYVLHAAIESWRAARDYNNHAAALHVQPYKKAEMDRFETRRSKLLDRFGKSFDGHYGWAAHILKPNSGDPVRSFADIEECALPHMRPYFQLASQNVHAKSKGIYHRLGLMDQREVLLAGASNAGLADPGQNAALFLCQITTVLGVLHVTFETLTLTKLTCRLQREVGDSFIRAHRQLFKDERQRKRLSH
jgi:hypothetical protein